MAGIPPHYAYALLFLTVCAKYLVPVLPADGLTTLCGFLAGLGVLRPEAVVLLAALGGTLGFTGVSGMAARVAEGRALSADTHKLRKAHVWLRRWGYGVVGFHRVLGQMRPALIRAAGRSPLSFGGLVASAAAGLGAWAALLVFSGYVVGQNWPVVLVYLETYSWLAYVLVLVVLGYLLWRLSRPLGRSSAGG